MEVLPTYCQVRKRDIKQVIKQTTTITNTLQSAAKKICKQYHCRYCEGTIRTFSGGRREQGGA